MTAVLVHAQNSFPQREPVRSRPVLPRRPHGIVVLGDGSGPVRRRRRQRALPRSPVAVAGELHDLPGKLRRRSGPWLVAPTGTPERTNRNSGVSKKYHIPFNFGTGRWTHSSRSPPSDTRRFRDLATRVQPTLNHCTRRKRPYWRYRLEHHARPSFVLTTRESLRTARIESSTLAGLKTASSSFFRLLVPSNGPYRPTRSLLSYRRERRLTARTPLSILLYIGFIDMPFFRLLIHRLPEAGRRLSRVSIPRFGATTFSSEGSLLPTPWA
ncbi:hypothetical protein SVXHx_3506 (plasmid) [Haloferax volcanii]|nr:hypothetical protein SVXHx_3506 [Haloferax lucentense]